MTTPMMRPYLFDHVLMNRIHVIDAMELCALLPNESVDAVLFDPPYGMGIDKWDQPIEILPFLNEVERVLKPKGFCAFTTQMPMMIDWLVALRATGLRYKDHIAWIKRKTTTSMLEINRSHEELFIYTKGVSKYHQTKGKYTDVKLPGLLVDAATIASVATYIENLHVTIRRGEPPTMKRRGDESQHKSHAGHSWMKEVMRSPEYVNFTNVWSFLPENLATLGGGHQHATMKPVKMWTRLIELTTPIGAVVFDPFVGSGTTALAARNCKRRYICGDQSPEYVAMARDRVRLPFEARQVIVNDDVSHLPMFAK